ncbi:MAG: YfhO family protein [Bacteroidota bacterium]
MNNWFKQNGVHLAIIGIFLGICFFYFTPSFSGKTLGQSDVIGAQSTQKEINDYKAKGTTILWTNQIFGGMPAYQIWAPYNASIATWVIKAELAVFPNPVGTMLILMLGAYLLFCVLKLNPWLAAAGAIAFSFSSYNIIYIVSGHANQVLAIAFFAPILAGILITLRGKYLTGGALTAFFLAMEIKSNHIQMTYYLLLALIILLGIELYHAVKTKTTPAFLKSMAYLGGALVLAILVNAAVLWSTFEYSKDSYRGPSNLTKTSKEPKNGLTKTYAYEWSQGVGECFTFLVPNAYGGGDLATVPLDKDSETAKLFIAKGQSEDQSVTIAQQLANFPGLSLYWGGKPGTGGPWYFGAVVCFLFVFGLIVVKNRLKWWILGTVLLTMFLSFGRNLPFLSDLFFNYFPLYNKFRAVESILAVASLCFPLLAFLAVQEIIDAKDKTYILKKLKLTLYIVGGLTIVLLAIPDTFLDFRSPNQAAGIANLSNNLQGDTAFATSIANALTRDRIYLARIDALRTLVFVLIAFGILWAFIKQKINLTMVSLALFALVLIDMWQIDKRYLKDSSYQDKVEADAVIKAREVDQFILRDTDPNYRVFDASANLKYDLTNPFFHKSIGGYSAARLKRFDELIDNQFTNGVNQDVLDMLNAKYIITTDPKSGMASMHVNSTACGHAWFVKKIAFADNADQEMQAISAFAPRDEAIVDRRYKSAINEKQLGNDPAATLTLTSYQPDHLTYQSSSATSQVAVFSEIYYEKGWKMLIDGKEQPYFRADYLLRAAQIPVGNHTIQFDFHPTSYYVGEKLSLAGSILLVLALGGAAYSGIKRKK